VTDWTRLRDDFQLPREVAYFAFMVFASHPRPVASRIEAYRSGLDGSGFPFFREQSGMRSREAAPALERYFGVEPGLGALTHGTAMGLAQVLGGVRLAPGQEILTSRNEHPATLDPLRFRSERDGTPYRQVPLFTDSRTATATEILENLAQAIRPETRVLVLTWVYSCDGVKLPITQIAQLVTSENERRAGEADRLLLVVDGVHGFGVEDTTFGELGADFFVSGCHKWIFGPRGTGIIAGRRDAWPHLVPLIATLAPASPDPALAHIPGGIVAFEHWWALAAAFEYQLDVLGKGRVQKRVRELAGRLKAGLAALPGATVVTPASPDLSSGIVCVDVGAMAPRDVLEHLTREKIVASQSAWDSTADRSHVRFSVTALNTEPEVDRAVHAIASLLAAAPGPRP